MFHLTVRVLALLGTGLAAGAALCILLAERAFAGSAADYVTYKQLTIRALTVPIPALGALGIAAAAIDAALLWPRGMSLPLSLTATAVLLNVAAMVLTRRGHFPLNDAIITWSPASAPAAWEDVRARWARIHTLRTASSVGSFVALVVGNVVRVAGE
jgi:uncharacterized membrane protein